MLKTLLSGLALTIAFGAQAGPSDLRLATSADTYPYNFGSAEGCKDSRGVCGFEIELFDAICAEAGLKCTWTVQPWGEVDSPGSILFNLVTPGAGGVFGFDAVVASASSTDKRKPKMDFSASYYTAWNIFVGKKALNVAFDANGFPLDQPSQKLKVGTWAGSLMEELAKAYGGATKHLTLVPVADPAAALKSGQVDLIFTFTGTEMDLIKGGVYAVKGKLIESTQESSVGAAFRKDAQGDAWRKKVNEGLVQVRKKGTYQKISTKWLGRDVWDCKFGPKFPGDGCN